MKKRSRTKTKEEKEARTKEEKEARTKDNKNKIKDNPREKPVQCDKKLSFQECELAILRTQVDQAQEKIAKRVVSSDEIQKVIRIVEDFIKRKGLICYGGTAINNILPEDDQFYDKEVEIADYDFFTTDGVKDSTELSDLYFKNGYKDVEAKSAQHAGTYKVFVNFIPVADITTLHKDIFFSLKREAIQVAGIYYAPPNFLRMSMFLELSRPAGDTSRWEKVAKRLALLNKNYPVTDMDCESMDFQREMANKENKEKEDTIYDTVRNTFINQGVVFFGGYAISLYSKYMPKHLQKKFQKIADFDVIAHEPETTAEIVVERLKDTGVRNANIVFHDPIGEIIPEHYEIRVGKDTIAFVYKPVACHSYNILPLNGQKVKVATIDTMLSFYLAFLYADKPYFSEFRDRILCMSKFLYDVQQKNRLEQKGLLKRFSITCFGHQESQEEMRSEKAKKFEELKNVRGTPEYNKWFFTYRPTDKKGIQHKVSNEKFVSKSLSRKKIKPSFFNPYNKKKTRRRKRGFF
jgi:hypothetical protein